MKEGLIFLLLFPVGIGFCQSTGDSKLVAEFFEIIVEKDSSDVEALLPYLDYRGVTIEKSRDEMIDIITFYAHLVHDSFNITNGEYSIVRHDSVDQKLLERYILQYDNLENVYYVVRDNDIVTPIIVENGKIVSFFTGLIQGTKKVHPIPLN